MKRIESHFTRAHLLVFLGQLARAAPLLRRDPHFGNHPAFHQAAVPAWGFRCSLGALNRRKRLAGGTPSGGMAVAARSVLVQADTANQSSDFPRLEPPGGDSALPPCRPLAQGKPSTRDPSVGTRHRAAANQGRQLCIEHIRRPERISVPPRARHGPSIVLRASIAWSAMTQAILSRFRRRPPSASSQPAGGEPLFRGTVVLQLAWVHAPAARAAVLPGFSTLPVLLGSERPQTRAGDHSAGKAHLPEGATAQSKPAFHRPGSGLAHLRESVMLVPCCSRQPTCGMAVAAACR